MRFVSTHIFRDFVKNLFDEKYSWDGQFASCTASDDYFHHGARLRTTESEKKGTDYFIKIA